MSMLKAITVALLVLNIITYTTYGVLADTNDGDAAENAIEKSELISLRNRRGLSAGMKPVINMYVATYSFSMYLCKCFLCDLIV